MSRIINLSDPPLPNGVLIGGVANFVTATKPVARVDGSALVIGDKWFNPNTGVDGFWNGTEWLGRQIIVGTGGYVSSSGTQNSSGSAALATYRLVSFSYQYSNAGTIDVNNFWTFTVRGLRSDGAAGIGYTNLSNIVITANFSALSPLVTVNANVLASSDFNGNARGYQIAFTRTLTAGELFFNSHAIYREIL